MTEKDDKLTFLNATKVVGSLALRTRSKASTEVVPSQIFSTRASRIDLSMYNLSVN